MISNFVTHLRSYTNSAIAGNSARSSTSPRRAPTSLHRAPTSLIEQRRLRIQRWRLCIERRRLRIQRRRLRIQRRRLRIQQWRLRIVASNDDCFMMFHNVLSVSWLFTSGSRCFTCVSWCFTMFNNVLWCLVSRATISKRAAASRLRDRDNAAGIGDNSAEIGDNSQKSAMAPQGSSISPRTWSHAKLRPDGPEWRQE